MMLKISDYAFIISGQLGAAIPSRIFCDSICSFFVYQSNCRDPIYMNHSNCRDPIYTRRTPLIYRRTSGISALRASIPFVRINFVKNLLLGINLKKLLQISSKSVNFLKQAFIARNVIILFEDEHRISFNFPMHSFKKISYSDSISTLQIEIESE